jgi:putative ABC transport system permease protein
MWEFHRQQSKSDTIHTPRWPRASSGAPPAHSSAFLLIFKALVSNGEARRREFAVRHALGANRTRLVRQFIVEAMLLLSVIGGGAGVLLANWLLGVLLALYPRQLPVSQAIAIDLMAALYAIGLVIAVGLLLGIVPALSATGKRLQDSLRGDVRTGTASRRAVAFRSTLVVAS